MNFTFEGNYKPRRYINLGGVKKVEDKKSLMLKAQNERKAREQERLRLKSAQRIQAFYRGRTQASLTRNQLRSDFQQLSASATQYDPHTILLATRQLITFYQPFQESDNVLLDSLSTMLIHSLPNLLSLTDRTTLDTWIWLICLLIKKAILPSIELGVQSSYEFLSAIFCSTTYPKQLEDESFIRIITFSLSNTSILRTIRKILTTSPPNNFNSTMKQALDNVVLQLMTFYPTSYYYAKSPLIERYHSNSLTQYLTKSKLTHRLVTELLIEPFLMDNITDTLQSSIAVSPSMKAILETVTTLIQSEQASNLKNDDIAGLLMNITILTDHAPTDTMKDILIEYAKTIQLLLAHLPVSFLTDPLAQQQANAELVNQASSSDDSSDDEETNEATDDDKDVIMKDIPPIVSPVIRARLTTLYSSDRINNLLSQFVQLLTNHSQTTSVAVVQTIANLLNTMMLRWPMKKDAILNNLLFHYKSNKDLQRDVLQMLWTTWAANTDTSDLISNDDRIMHNLTATVEMLTTGASLRSLQADNTEKYSNSWSILYLLCEVYARLLLTLSDDEFFSHVGNPLSLEQVIELSRQLKNLSFVMFWRANSMDLSQTIGSTGIQLSQLRFAVTHLLQQIHMRDSRRKFCPKGHWLIKDLDTDNFSSEAVAEEFNLESEEQQQQEPENDVMYATRRPRRRPMLSKGRLAIISPRLGLLNNIPFVIPFKQRVEIFRMFVANDKKRNHIDEFFHHRNAKAASATVRRDHIFEDGFNALHNLSPEILKGRIAISFVDEFGLEEAGIDGGGVFKEFLTGLSREAFDLNYGLFTVTSEQLLYPNPSSYATELEQLEYFQFLGLIIGKAVYEGILLDVAFAEFFLKKCLGKVNYLDDLSSLDPELYKGLLAVKNYKGNVEDLSLDFTSTHMEADGKSVSVDLIPNGSNIPVTNQNRIHYIYSVANYRLNVQIAKQCRAFFRGLSTIIDVKWLRMFNQQELQILLGGTSGVPIDLQDLRAHTVLAGYTERDSTVQNFWRALESFDNELRMKFVKFVTSCSRPPLLGFKELVPQFCLRNAGPDQERLPTSSTCVNLLKLPQYSSYETLREKLLYAITADAGFDLS